MYVMYVYVCICMYVCMYMYVYVCREVCIRSASCKHNDPLYGCPGNIYKDHSIPIQVWPHLASTRLYSWQGVTMLDAVVYGHQWWSALLCSAWNQWHREYPNSGRVFVCLFVCMYVSRKIGMHVYRLSFGCLCELSSWHLSSVPHILLYPVNV